VIATSLKFLAAQAEPSTKPFAIICGSQPGAKKGILHEMNRQKNLNIINIDVSKFHRLHPHFKTLQSSYSTEYMKHTHDFASMVAKELIERLSEQKYNLLIDTPLREPIEILETCRFLKEQSYSVELHALSMRREELWQGMQDKNRAAIRAGFEPMKISMKKHNEILTKSLEGIDKISKAKVFDRISLFTQDQQCIYDSLEIPNINPRVMLHSDVLNNENEVTRNNKDEFFRDLFKDKERFVDLYKACSGKEINPDEITPFSLDSSVLTRPLENDGVWQINVMPQKLFTSYTTPW